MKDYLMLKLILLFLVGSFQVQSQDLKLNPVLALVDAYKGGLEFQINPNVGLETEVLVIKDRGSFFILHGKYYFKPYYGTDVIYLGIMAGAGGQKDGESGVGIGAEAGIKAFGKRNLFCEFSFGVHSAIKKVDIPVYFKLMVGYRFSRKKKD